MLFRSNGGAHGTSRIRGDRLCVEKVPAAAVWRRQELREAKGHDHAIAADRCGSWSERCAGIESEFCAGA